jgi:DNA-binding NarL/FixJ family response regulator
MSYTTTNSVGIYVTEEQEIYKQIYKTSFETDPDFKFLGIHSGNNDQTLIDTLNKETPNVLLMGIKRFDTKIYEQIENICSTKNSIGIVLLLTVISESETAIIRKIVQKCSHGIAIYLKQSLDNPRQLHNIVSSVSRGQVLFDPKVAGSIMMEKSVSPFIKLLTERELEILNLLSLGYTNLGIAKSLCIDVKTVAHHLNNIYSKLKEDERLDEKHPRVSVARLYLETTGELVPLKAMRAVSMS